MHEPLIPERIIVDARLPWGSGIGRYVSNTVPRVAALLSDTQFELIVGQHSRDAAEQAAAGSPNIIVTIIDIDPFSISEQLKMPGILARADLVWFTNYWVPLAYRGRFVAAVHDLLHQERALFPAGFIKRTLSWWTFRHVARTAEAVCYLSRFSKREFDRQFGGAPLWDICGCGIDHALSVPFDAEQPPKKTRQVLVVAAPKQHKNFAIAINAFRNAQLAEDWRLVVVSPGDSLRSSIDLNAIIDNDARIIHVNSISDSELRSLYADSAIVMMPSRYEGFGLPLAEGLQAGAQCISSTAEALVEVGQGAYVTFVNPLDNEGWVTALTRECARFDAGAVPASERSHNMRHVAQFRWDDVARRTATLIKTALSDTRDARTP